MSPNDHNNRLAPLLTREQGLADELLTLAQAETNCCESSDTDRLVEIVAQRKEVMSSWHALHKQTAAALQDPTNSNQISQGPLKDAIDRINETIASIKATDQISLERLTLRANQDLGKLQNLNQASRWLHSLDSGTQSYAYSSRE